MNRRQPKRPANPSEFARSQDPRECTLCGVTLTQEDHSDLCPVCLLRSDLEPNRSDDAIREEPTVPLPEISARRFGHYEIARRSDGSLHELGHGAMGITFKAIDLNLRIPIALKVLNHRLFQEESARRRFFREARAAASVRHPNVATVYHLGFRGRDIFYAMEFVEGETLDSLIQRVGRLELKSALETTKLVAAGLDAIHKQNLVHRDIKPSNIMIAFDAGRLSSAKIIDLGLAKAVTEGAFESEISIPGVFAGTPAFASPEQFAGVGVDIRSDLYSLGVTLWKLLSGQAPFVGTPAEIMHQHQYAPLPLDRLPQMPPPALTLVRRLLEKGPAQRFQKPAEVVAALEKITGGVIGTTPAEGPRNETAPQPAQRPKTTEDLGAYDLYLRGMALVELLDRPANEKAIVFFKRAIDKDANFALAYCGLARAYVEQDGFVNDKSLLDSAVQNCRMAIALDPSEMRGYEQLGRAYFAKGWYAQCDKALEKALELGPDDGRTNALAAMRHLAKQDFATAYRHFQKAYAADQSEPRWVYYAAKILFGVGLADVADRWIRQALDRESNPQRHHMMECYRAMWRGQFAAASSGFAQLPPDLKDYDYSVADGLLFCAIGTQNWPAVIQFCNDQLDSMRENISLRTYLAVATDAVGRKAQAREMAREIVRCGLERLEQPGQLDVPWDVPLYVAWAERYLQNKPQAYDYLRRFLANRTLLHVPLGLKNPILHVFREDPEFLTIAGEMHAKFDVVRQAIGEGETGIAGDG
jgi:tetratricopeptide (TPR) repeat protein